MEMTRKTLIIIESFYKNSRRLKNMTCNFLLSGVKIMAGQWTMSGLIADLTGQILVLLVILTGHF